MPKGPKGERRSADVIKNAVHVMHLATGEATESLLPQSGRSRSGKAGAAARAEKLSPEKRKAISVAAAKKRWSRERSED